MQRQRGSLLNGWRLSGKGADLVKVDTKHYGKKTGLLVKINDDVFGCDVVVLVVTSHRRIMANPWDVEVISASR